MTEEAIADTVAAFARAAGDAKRLGFDAAEIHGAHGYLVDQFFGTAPTRERTATAARRSVICSRFAAEVVKAMRTAVGPDFPLILRVSQWKQQDFTARLAETPDAMADWLVPLAEAGVDIFHCSQRRFWEPEFPEVDGLDGLNFAGWAKKVTGVATITVGSVGLLGGDFLASFIRGEGSRHAGLERLVARMERNDFDLVAVGRAILGDPRWVAKVRAGDAGSLQDFSASALAELV